MRVGGDSTKLKNIIKKLNEDLSIAKLYHRNYITCIILKILRKINQYFYEKKNNNFINNLHYHSFIYSFYNFLKRC